jgi:hypothetical protein
LRYPGREISIPRLRSGGLIVTYQCTSRCRHCLYASSPRREARYIDAAGAASAFAAVRRHGCDSLHVGGGEPFMDPPGLLAVARAARDHGIRIEYVETNSSWFRDASSAARLLEELLDAGISTLLVSISPFHTEYVPFARVRGVMEACRSVGVAIFPWVEEFIPDLEALDESATHTIEEHGGIGYLRSLPSRYWINLSGRAVLTYREALPRTPLARLPRAGSGCSELTGTSHFHVDLHGAYVPGLCSGLSVALGDLSAPLDPKQYPLITRLALEGPAALLEWARAEHGFEPQESYLNKCDLCLDIRRFLARSHGNAFPELSPAGFYEQLASE